MHIIELNHKQQTGEFAGEALRKLSPSKSSSNIGYKYARPLHIASFNQQNNEPVTDKREFERENEPPQQLSAKKQASQALFNPYQTMKPRAA